MYKSNEEVTKKTIAIINVLESYGFSPYKIHKITGLPHNYIYRWKSGTTPRVGYYKILSKLYHIVITIIESFNGKQLLYEEIEKRVYSTYQKFATSPLYDMLKPQYIRRPSHISDKLNTNLTQ